MLGCSNINDRGELGGEQRHLVMSEVNDLSMVVVQHDESADIIGTHRDRVLTQCSAVSRIGAISPAGMTPQI
jgi:hypothetical protein